MAAHRGGDTLTRMPALSFQDHATRPPAGPSLPVTLWRTLRPPFLLLTPACVSVGLASASRLPDAAIHAADLALVLGGAVAAHASVNVLNEWHDAASGLDARTRRTPFSGGSGALQARPDALRWALGLGLLLLMITAAAGLVLLTRHGLALLPIGLAGLALVLAYTPWLTRHPGLCLLAPGLGVGPLMVVGAQLALSGRHSVTAWVASLVPGLLGSGLLLLNQFPDVVADGQVGRRHLPLAWGRPRAARMLGWLLCGVFGVLLLGVWAGALPLAVLALLPAALPAAWVARQSRRHADAPQALLPAMGLNVALCLGLPAALALALWCG